MSESPEGQTKSKTTTYECENLVVKAGQVVLTFSGAWAGKLVVDGREIHDLTDIKVDAPLGELPRLTVTIICK